MKPTIKLTWFNKNLIKQDFYTTYYFLKTTAILINEHLTKSRACLQFKCFNDNYMVAGVYEAIELIKLRLDAKDFNQLKIYYLDDGTIANEQDCVLAIEGPYYLFANLENIIDGILARRSSVATNCYNFLKYLTPEQILFMADRSDDYHLMPYDGYSASVAGIFQFSNQAHMALLNESKQYKLIGTMPHSLIQQFHGDIIACFKSYIKLFPSHVSILIDYHNDVIGELEKLEPYLMQIQSVRIDTSNDLIDKSLQTSEHQLDHYGSCAELFILVREWLDKRGFNHVKLICSSNNDLDKIKYFSLKQIPVDYYGIGSNLIKLNLHFTADLVSIDNIPEAKVGRKMLSMDKMKVYQNEKFLK